MKNQEIEKELRRLVEDTCFAESERTALILAAGIVARSAACTCPDAYSFGHEPGCPLLAQMAQDTAHAENARLRGRIKAWELSMPLNPKWDWLKEEMNKEAGPTVPIDSEESRLREQLDKAHGAQLALGLENHNLGKQRDGLKSALQDIAEFWHGDRDPLVLRHVCEHDRRIARHVLSTLANDKS